MPKCYFTIAWMIVQMGDHYAKSSLDCLPFRETMRPQFGSVGRASKTSKCGGSLGDASVSITPKTREWDARYSLPLKEVFTKIKDK